MNNFFSKELPKNSKKSALAPRSSRKRSSGSQGASKKQGLFRSALASTAVTKAKTQSYLDFGQKSFGKSIACPRCNMLYVAGVEEDETNHMKYCRSRQQLSIDSLSVKSLRHTWADASVASSDQGQVVWRDSNKDSIIIKMDMDSEVFRGKSKASAQRWRDVVEIILTDMGAHDSTMDEKGCSLYFYVSTKLHQVLGMIISEMVRSDDLHMFCPKEYAISLTENALLNENSMPNFTQQPSLQEKQKYVEQLYSSTVSENSMRDTLTLFSDKYTLLSPVNLRSPTHCHMPAKAPLCGPFAIGVKQMWVSALHRRQGIAHQLLECVRTSAVTDTRCPHFIPSHERFKICFSQPTSDGLSCALRYVEPSNIVWLYSQSSVT